MISEKQKQEIRKFVESQVIKNDLTHQMSHIDETVKWALELAFREKADIDICWASAMLHDICKWEEENGFDHGTKGSEVAKNYLESIGIDSLIVENVRDAIYYHNKPFSGGPVERSVLWDADKIYIMLPEGFEKRMLPYWRERAEEKEAVRQAIEEYWFFFPLFHTYSGKREVSRHRSIMEEKFKLLSQE